MSEDAENLYFGFRGAGESRWAIRKVSKNGGETAKLDTGYANGVIADGKTLVYFVSSDDVYSFPK